MDPIQTIGELTSGDVVHHPALGFAVVDQVDGEGATLAWENQGPRLPASVSTELLSKGYRRCTPGGFLQKSVLGRDILRTLVNERPVHAVRMLLDELGEALGRSQIHDWMTGRDIIPTGQFDRWWADLETAVAEDSSLCWNEEGRALSLPEAGESEFNPEAFLASTPRIRWRIADEAEPEVRVRLLHQALTARDTEAILLLLRLGDSIPDKARNALRKLAIHGNYEVAAALLARRDEQITRRLVAPAGRRDGRDEVLAILQLLSPTRRLLVAVDMIEAALAIEGDPPAATWLCMEMPGGPGALLDAAVNHASERAIEWLTERAATRDTDGPQTSDEDTLKESEPTLMDGDTLDVQGTVEQDRSTQPLLAQLRDLPPERLLSLSIAAAHALSLRHATGDTGGVAGARVTEDGLVRLGPEEDRLPAEDVRDVMRLLLEAAIGPLPTERPLTDEELMVHTSLLRPDLPMDWLAVLNDALAANPEQRPPDGTSLWVRLARAKATHDVRRDSPTVARYSTSVAHDTHIGLLKSRIMQTNQDAVFYTTSGGLTLLLVADGISVSTAGSGNLASALLVQSISASWERDVDSLRTSEPQAITDWLVFALEQANTAICERSLHIAGGSLQQQIPMGTTAVMAILRGNEAFLVSVGDSRAYLVNDNGVALLTGDQNVRGLWLETARRGESGDFGEGSFALVGYCGRFDEHQEPCPAEPVQRAFLLLPGETLCLCTDGLTDYAAETVADMNAIIAEGVKQDTLAAGCRYLVDRANAGGGGDNISIMLAQLSPA